MGYDFDRRKRFKRSSVRDRIVSVPTLELEREPVLELCGYPANTIRHPTSVPRLLCRRDTATLFTVLRSITSIA